VFTDQCKFSASKKMSPIILLALITCNTHKHTQTSICNDTLQIKTGFLHKK